MTKRVLRSWLRVTLGRLYWPAYWLAIFLGIIVPLLLYLASNVENFRLAPRVGFDTNFVAIWWLPSMFIVSLVVIGAIAWLQTPHRATMVRKLTVSATGGRGLIIPLALAGLAFYAPMPVLAWFNSLGSQVKGGFVVATPLIQSSFSVYLVVLSVAALIRYFFITATVQTGVSGFIRNLTIDLKKLASRGKGHLTISLPWLAFGKFSLDPDLFDEFRSALEKCISKKDILVKIHTLHMSTIRRGAKRVVCNSENEVDEEDIRNFLDCELGIRRLAGELVKTAKQEDLLGCVIIDEKLYAVHTLLHKAQEYGHLGEAFISMEIHNESICSEYRKRLEPSASSSAVDQPRC